MGVNDKFVQGSENLIQNKIRGKISYYSINQVADLLNEDLSNIKYYTNIFDDMLKIEIVNKELQYKNEDINKLEFLIKLKNKGMTIKEIEEYYNKISFNESEVKEKSSNLISVEDLITNIIDAEAEHFSKFKSDFLNDIQKSNAEYLKNITETLIESQTKNLNDFKHCLSNEIKEYIDSNFKAQNEKSLELHNELIDKTTGFISEKIDTKSEELTSTIKEGFENLTCTASTQSENLVKEVQSFKRVINDAYYIRSEMLEPSHEGFFSKLKALFSN